MNQKSGQPPKPAGQVLSIVSCAGLPSLYVAFFVSVCCSRVTWGVGDGGLFSVLHSFLLKVSLFIRKASNQKSNIKISLFGDY